MSTRGSAAAKTKAARRKEKQLAQLRAARVDGLLRVFSSCPWEPNDEIECRGRGKAHWYPATVIGVSESERKVDFSYNKEWRRLGYPPPPPPRSEYSAEPARLRHAGEKRSLQTLFEACGGTDWSRKVRGGRWRRARSDSCAHAQLREHICARSQPLATYLRTPSEVGWDRADVKKMPRDARPFYEDVSRWDGIGVTEGRVSQINLTGVGVVGAMPGTRFFQGT